MSTLFFSGRRTDIWSINESMERQTHSLYQAFLIRTCSLARKIVRLYHMISTRNRRTWCCVCRKCRQSATWLPCVQLICCGVGSSIHSSIVSEGTYEGNADLGVFGISTTTLPLSMLWADLTLKVLREESALFGGYFEGVVLLIADIIGEIVA